MNRTLLSILAICCVAFTSMAEGSVRWLETTHNFGAFDESVGPVSCRFSFVNTVNERRMHPMTAKITGTHQSVPPIGHPAGNSKIQFVPAELHLPYFFNMPAKRPVEKAICRL